MVDQTLGDVTVEVDGDIAPLLAKFEQARRAAEKFYSDFGKSIGGSRALKSAVDGAAVSIERKTKAVRASSTAAKGAASADIDLASKEKVLSASTDQSSGALNRKAAAAKLSEQATRSAAQAEIAYADKVRRSNEAMASRKTTAVTMYPGPIGPQMPATIAPRAAVARSGATAGNVVAMKAEVDETKRLNDAYDRLTASYRPLQVAGEKYQRDLADIAALQKRGNLTTAAAAELNAAAAAKYSQSASAINKTGTSVASLITPFRAIAGVIGVQMVKAFADVTIASIKSTAAIGYMAEKLGIGTTALQELRQAGESVGVSSGQVDNALEKLGDSIDKASAGSEREKKLFDALGISLVDAGGKARSVEQILPDVADALSHVGNEAERGAAGTIIFGDAWDQAKNLLNGGSEKIDQLRTAVRDLGATMSEDEIKNADKTAKKLQQVKAVLEADISQFVSKNSEAILGLATSFATAAGSILSVISRLNQFFAGSSGWAKSIRFVAEAFNPLMGGLSGAIYRRSGNQTNPKRPYLGLDNGASAFNGYSASLFDKPQKSGKNISLSTLLASKPPKGSGGGSSRGRSGPDAGDRQNRFDQERQRLEEQLLQSLESETRDAGAKAELQEKLLDIDRAQYEDKLKHDVHEKRLTASQAKELMLQYDKLDAQKRLVIGLRLSEAQRKGDLDIAQAQSDNEQEVLHLQESLATTAADRRRIQLEILDSETQQAINAQDSVIYGGIANEYDIEIAKAKKEQLLAIKDQKAELIKRGTRNPVEEYLASARPGSQGEIDAAKMQIVADKLRQIDQATVAFADNFADAFGRAASALANFESPLKVLKGLVADLAQQFTQEFIEKPIADFVRRKAGAPIAERLVGGRASGTGLDASQANVALAGFAQSVRNATLALGGGLGGNATDLLGGNISGALDPLAVSAQAVTGALDKQVGSLDEFGISLVNVLGSLTNINPGSVSGGGGFFKTLLGLGQMAAGAGAFGGGGLGQIQGVSNNPGFFDVSHISGLPGHAAGGMISGPGTGSSDSILAHGPRGMMRVANGEFLTNASAAKRHRGLLETINSNRMPNLGAMMGAGFMGGHKQRPNISFGDIVVQSSGGDPRMDRKTGKQVWAELHRHIARTTTQGIA